MGGGRVDCEGFRENVRGRRRVGGRDRAGASKKRRGLHRDRHRDRSKEGGRVRNPYLNPKS